MKTFIEKIALAIIVVAMMLISFVGFGQTLPSHSGTKITDHAVHKKFDKPNNVTYYSEAYKNSSAFTGTKSFDENEVSLPFDAVNGSIVSESQNGHKQILKYDSTYLWPMINRFIILAKIDPKRISNHPDSLQITPEGLKFKLKPLN